ncbi:MAG: RHS repeat-associated core domain-containing protein, partial [Demequinaceae bacterium]|nr:RHS repeat-associated core domain-containing protein [Demequinaceae bacterium]
LAPATLADASDVTRTSYTPYGKLRGADNAATDRGWLGQVEDRVDGASGTGLTYLNARYYDPTTMRFISPDPLMDLGDPKTLDPYRYADNNPVVFTDASGLKPIEQYDCVGTSCKSTSANAIVAAAVKAWIGGSAGTTAKKPKVGNFDWGTTSAGGVNLVWGATSVSSGVKEVTAAIPLAGSPLAPAAPWVGLKGLYDIGSGGMKFLRGIKQIGYGTTHRCAVDCGVDGNIRKLAWGTIPGATVITQGLPTLPGNSRARNLATALPVADDYLYTADWYNGAPRESVVGFLEGPRAKIPVKGDGSNMDAFAIGYNFTTDTRLIPPASYRDDYTGWKTLDWLDYLGGAP